MRRLQQEIYKKLKKHNWNAPLYSLVASLVNAHADSTSHPLLVFLARCRLRRARWWFAPPAWRGAMDRHRTWIVRHRVHRRQKICRCCCRLLLNSDTIFWRRCCIGRWRRWRSDIALQRNWKGGCCGGERSIGRIRHGQYNAGLKIRANAEQMPSIFLATCHYFPLLSHYAPLLKHVNYQFVRWESLK